MGGHEGCGCARPSRRALLAGLGALTLPLAPASAEPAPRRVDVHHHFFPPGYLERIPEVVGSPPSPAMTGWSTAQVLDHMDKAGVATGIASISPWGPHFKDAAEARHLARLCNDYAAQMNRDHKGRFGLFAAVFAELNRRKAVVYFHPNTPNCCGRLVPGTTPSLIEWPYDTGRAVVSLLFGGALARYPDIKFIFSHAGGPLPALSGRIANASKNRKDLAEIAPHGILAELAKLHYDTANAYTAPSMAALLKLVPVSQVLFGTDYPYYTLEETVAGLAALNLSEADYRAIDRGNAAWLMPRFAG